MTAAAGMPVNAFSPNYQYFHDQFLRSEGLLNLRLTAMVAENIQRILFRFVKTIIITLLHTFAGSKKGL
jgi:hypothetical protein